jgi:hypothetical protein
LSIFLAGTVKHFAVVMMGKSGTSKTHKILMMQVLSCHSLPLLITPKPYLLVLEKSKSQDPFTSISFLSKLVVRNSKWIRSMRFKPIQLTSLE